MLPEDFLYRRRATAPRQPMDERLPDGTPAILAGMQGPLAQLLAGAPTLADPTATRPRTVGQPPLPTMASLGAPPPMALNLPMPPPPGGPVPANTPAPPVHLGAEVSPDASTLQRLLAERAALSQADPSSRVRRTDWGYEQLPPEQSPSRVRHAGIGAAHGAIIAGQATNGDPWGTLAGTLVGALGGGVSPSLIQAFTRRQELDRNAGELATEQKLQLQNAQLGETLAQAEQRRLEPYLKAEELRAQNERFEATERGRNERATQSNRTRMQTATEANAARKAALEETMRHNREMEKRPVGSNERVVANTIFRKDENGVYHVAPGAPPPMTTADLRAGEKSVERDEKARQAEALFRKGSEYWDQAQQKREEARRLGLGPDGQPSRVAASRNEEAIRRLTREAENLENKTRDVQVRGDMLDAEAKSGPAASGGGGGRTIEGAIEAFKADKRRNPTGRAPTAEEIERMRKALERNP